MKNVAGRKSKDDVTNAKIEVPLKDREQIKAVSADPYVGVSVTRPGRKWLQLECRKSMIAKRQNLPTIVLSRESRCF